VRKDTRSISGPPSWRHGPLGHDTNPPRSWIRRYVNERVVRSRRSLDKEFQPESSRESFRNERRQSRDLPRVARRLTKLPHLPFAGSATGIPGVPENITVMFLNPTSVRVSWSTSQVEQVEKYDVTYKPTDARCVSGDFNIARIARKSSESEILGSVPEKTPFAHRAQKRLMLQIIVSASMSFPEFISRRAARDQPCLKFRRVALPVVYFSTCLCSFSLSLSLSRR